MNATRPTPQPQPATDPMFVEIREDHPATQPATRSHVERNWPGAELIDPDSACWVIDVPHAWTVDLERDGSIDVAIDGLRVTASLW